MRKKVEVTQSIEALNEALKSNQTHQDELQVKIKQLQEKIHEESIKRESATSRTILAKEKNHLKKMEKELTRLIGMAQNLEERKQDVESSSKIAASFKNTVAEIEAATSAAEKQIAELEKEAAAQKPKSATKKLAWFRELFEKKDKVKAPKSADEIPAAFNEEAKTTKKEAFFTNPFKNWGTKKKASENQAHFFKPEKEIKDKSHQVEKPTAVRTVTKKFEFASHDQFNITALMNDKNEVKGYKYRIEGNALKDNRQKNLWEFVYRAFLSGQLDRGMKLTGTLQAIKDTVNALHQIMPDYDKPIIVTLKQDGKTETFPLSFRNDANWDKLGMPKPVSERPTPDIKKLIYEIKHADYPESGSLIDRFVDQGTFAKIPQFK